MQSIIGDYLGQAKIAEAQAHLNLAVFPILSDYSAKTDYLPLDEALAHGVIEIGEMGEAGTVPRLFLKNRADREVLLLDGEELVGAKQNRILNTTILVGACAEVEIPVSCVEAGRWAYRAKHFGSERRMAYATLRAQKNTQVNACLRGGGTFDGDQSAIWAEIGQRTSRRGVASTTRAMADVYAHEAASLGDYAAQFRALDRQVGAVFAIDGRVVGVECFGRARTCAAVLPKLVESYALDALDAGAQAPARQATLATVKRFLSDTAKAQVESRPSVALGTDARIESDHVQGLALLVGAELIHLSAFKKNRRGRRKAAA